jgi:hypothetical protein
MNSKLFNPIKNKIAATIALLFFVLLGAGTMMAMKAPDKAKTPVEKKTKKVVATKKLANSFWVYNGGTVTSESSYSLASGNPCDGNTNLCEISAPEDPSNPGHPQIVAGSSLATRITNKDTSAGDVFLQD